MSGQLHWPNQRSVDEEDEILNEDTRSKEEEEGSKPYFSIKRERERERASRRNRGSRGAIGATRTTDLLSSTVGIGGRLFPFIAAARRPPLTAPFSRSVPVHLGRVVAEPFSAVISLVSPSTHCTHIYSLCTLIHKHQFNDRMSLQLIIPIICKLISI